MKKIIIWGICIFFAIPSLKAQTDTTENDSLTRFIENWKYTFDGLDKNQIPTGMLKEYAVIPLSFESYNGKKDSTIDIFIIKKLHSDCNAITIDNSKLPLSFDSIENRASRYRDRGINPLVILDYTYNTFHDSAWEWHLLDTLNNQLVDVSNRSLSPYVAENTFGISPYYFSISNNATVSFYLGTDMYLGNNPAMISHLEINYGNGWEPLTIGVNSFTFSSFGVFDVRIRYNKNSDEKIYINSFKIAITPSIKELGNEFYYGDIQADIEWEGEKYQGQYVYRLGKGNSAGCIKKPFIITDGIDFGYDTDKGCGWEKCKDGKCNSLGFIDIYTGWDHNYSDGSKWGKQLPEFAKGELLFNSLYDEGYDVIFLDYKAGAGHMQANAMLLIKLIDSINHYKCSNEELIVCGPSMGGQIVRYALAYMETHNMKHCVRTGVYFDSPHTGANIPIGMQLFLNYFKTHNFQEIFNDAATTIDQKLNRPATRQLLNNHFSTYGYGQAQERTDFMNDLQNNIGGYAKEIRQVAIPNGSCNLITQPFSKGAKIIDMELPIVSEVIYTLNNYTNGVIKVISFIARHTGFYVIGGAINGGFNIRGVSYATNGDENNENRIFYGDAAGYNNKEKINWTNNSTSYDNAPGSSSDALKYFENLLQHKDSRRLWEVTNAPFPTSTFIPTNSSLGLVSDDLYYNINSELTNEDIPNHAKYKFDAFYRHDGNQIHVEMTGGIDGNIQWLIKELKRTENIVHNLPGNYTYWGTDNQNHTVQTSTFNFGNHFRHILNDVQINSGGQLLVNKDLSTNYGLTNDFYNTTLQHFTGDYFALRTANCGSEVEINNGGTFSIGDNNTPINNKGIVYIKEGSNLYLHGGSNLYLYWGSKLIIEKGATLFVDPGATIYIEDAASIEIKGQLNLSNNAVFKHSGPGKVIFNNTDNTFSISATNGSSIEFKSTNNDNKLEILGTITTPSQLGMFKVEGAIVTTNSNSGFNLYSPVYFDYATFTPSAANSSNHWNGMVFNNQTDNNVHIDHSKFYNATTALDFSIDYALTSPSFYLDEFYSNTLAFSIHDAGFTLNNCIFKDNTKALNANWITASSVIRACNFKDNNLGIDYQGNTNATLLLKNNNVISSDVQIISPSTNQFLVTMGCNRFTSTTIGIDYASVNLSSTTLHNASDYGGYNIFKESPLALSDIKYLNLATGLNDFIKTSGYYLYGAIKNSNNLSSSQSSNNYFDRINGGAYPLPNGILSNVYSGKINLLYNSANANFKLYGTLSSQQNGGCQAGGAGQAPIISKMETGITNTILYPNPTSDKINIQLPETENQANTAVYIMDMQGKMLIKGSIASGATLYTIDVLQLPAGMYIVVLQDGEKTERLRFVKN